jgi:Ca-activated chloride channel family protein
VSSYRLVGYENRTLTAEEFRDDRKDAGDLGAGHSVTFLYELIPAGSEPLPADSFAVRLRYKPPQLAHSRELSVPGSAERPDTTSDFRFAAAVAQFGMLLRNSEHKGASSFASTLALAEPATRGDARRVEFLALVREAADRSQQALSAQPMR